MANNNIQIKLTADGKQARQEIKLIDQDLKNLGNKSNNTIGGKSESQKGNNSETQTASQHGGVEREYRRRSIDVNTRMLKELSLLRKELHRLNNNNSTHFATQDNFSSKQSTASGTQSTPNKENNTANSNNTAGGSKGSTSKQSTTSSKPLDLNPTIASKLSTFSSGLSKIGMALASTALLGKTISTLNGWAESSQSGMSLAYRTYGATLGYDNYALARKDTADMGAEYGYSMQDTMGAVGANISQAGFTTKDDLKADTDAILKVSKSFGLDASSTSSAFGNLTAIGTVKQGDQKKLADMFAESLAQSNMTSRADQQLDVLQQLVGVISSKSTTVDLSSVQNAMGAYTALTQQNQNLRGSRGADIISSVESFTTSSGSNQQLKFLLGLGGKQYQGVSGEMRLQEQMEKDPMSLMKEAYGNYKKLYGNSQGELDPERQAMFQKFLMQNSGLSASQSKEFMQTMDTGYADLTSTENGQKATDERYKNYKSDKVSIGEEYQNRKQSAKDDIGDGVNAITSKAKNLFNDLGDGGRMLTVGAGAILSGLGGMVGMATSLFGPSIFKSIGGGLKNIWKGKKTAPLAETAKDTAKATSQASKATFSGAKATEGVASSVDDVIKATSQASKATANGASSVGATAEGVASATKSTSALSKLGSSSAKGIAKKAGLVGVAIDVADTGINVKRALDKDDNREASQETGGLLGRLSGAWAGAKLGAMGGGAIGSGPGAVIGGIIGAIGGLFVGDKVGQFLGETGYDVFGNGKQLSTDQKTNVKSYYDKVNEIYQTKGSSEAKDYVNKVVTPYLSSIGVSKSYTDAYEFDLGKNDFLEDVRKGVYGADVLADESMYVNTDGSVKSGGDLWKAYANSYKVPESIPQKLAHIPKDVESLAPTDNASKSVPKDSQNISVQSDNVATDNNTQAINRNTEALNNASKSVPKDSQNISVQSEKSSSSTTTSVSEDIQNTTLQKSIEDNTRAIESTVNLSPLNESPVPSTLQPQDLSALNATTEEDNGWFSGISNLFKSHAVGNDYVPYDNYLASLHKGEMVLNKMDADQVRQKGSLGSTNSAGKSSTIQLDIKLSGGVDGMTASNQERVVQAVVSRIASSTGLQSMLSNGFMRVQNI